MKKILFLSTIICVGYFTIKDRNLSFSSKNTVNSPNNIINSNCKIKGNISISSGNKIYHVPGQQDYENTRIQSEHGERWFCSEEEAIKAGWRKAPR